MSDLLESLTDAQREAVTHTEGPMLVLAGAGSGKTRVVTRRAAYLARTVTTPRHVLAITFTNKAVGEMRERLEQLGIGPEMTICTFHALGARLLRWFAAEAGLPPNFTIFDESARKQVIKEAVSDASLSLTQFTPGVIVSRISDAKNHLLTPEAYAEQAQDFLDNAIARIYRHYQDRLRRQQAVDFDDLLMITALLLGRSPELRDRLEERFRYVLIDEYQDTNHPQYMIARGLTLKNENLCATGDPDQSIYAWRGADIRNILEFEKDFPRARVVRLEQNYRSTQQILAAAGRLIEFNTQRKPKKLWTENEKGAPVVLKELEDASDEAQFLVDEFAAHRRAGGSLEDIAVFYRINSLSRVIEEALLRGGIPYQIARGTEFYNRKEIKDLVAYLRVLVNPADEVAFARSINNPARGIGKTTLEHLRAFAAEQHMPVFEAARRAGGLARIKPGAAAQIASYVELMTSFAGRLHEPAEIIVSEMFAASGLQSSLRAAEGGEDALENIGELISAAADFTLSHPPDEASLVHWMEQLALVSDVDNVNSGSGAVTLMTLHAAKGLEFPRVYMIGLEEGLLPHVQYNDDPADIEEERRLCFVGMTRARQHLTLSYSRWRMLRGLTTRTTPSQFLDELAGEAGENAGTAVTWGREQPPPRLRDDPAHRPLPRGEFDHLRPGSYLRHPTYGVGRMLWKQPSGQFTRAGIRFPAYGEKVLILEYAKMQPLDPDECQL